MKYLVHYPIVLHTLNSVIFVGAVRQEAIFSLHSGHDREQKRTFLWTIYTKFGGVWYSNFQDYYSTCQRTFFCKKVNFHVPYLIPNFYLRLPQL
jgi:hypothetical protein